MIKQEKFFEDIYQYVDLWAAGYVKTYIPQINDELYSRLKIRFVEAVLDRFDAINKLRVAIGLDAMSVDDCYDYYVNNLPEFDEQKKVIDLYSYDKKTKELSEKEKQFTTDPRAEAYLLVMGAPDVFLENSHVVQERIDHINRLLVEGGYKKITPKKTEEILEKLLVVSNW